jgi:hypothetical protein
MLKYNMPDLGAKCATYLSKGSMVARTTDPGFTTQTESACDIYRIQKGLPKPPGQLGGRSRRRRRMRGGMNSDGCPTAGNLKANGSRATMANSAACTLKKRLAGVKSSGLGKGGRSRRGRRGRKSGRRTRRH